MTYTDLRKLTLRNLQGGLRRFNVKGYEVPPIRMTAEEERDMVDKACQLVMSLEQRVGVRMQLRGRWNETNLPDDSHVFRDDEGLRMSMIKGGHAYFPKHRHVIIIGVEILRPPSLVSKPRQRGCLVYIVCPSSSQKWEFRFSAINNNGWGYVIYYELELKPDNDFRFMNWFDENPLEVKG